MMWRRLKDQQKSTSQSVDAPPNKKRMGDARHGEPSEDLMDNDDDDYLSEVEENTTERRGDDDDDGDPSQRDSSSVIAQPETRAVNRSKILVYLVIALAAAAMGTATFYFMTKQAEQDFEAEFMANAVEVVDESENIAVGVFGQLFSLATSLTSYAISTKSSFPNVTDMHFNIRASESQDLTGAEMYVFAPIVLDPQHHHEWEAYARENQGWFNVTSVRGKVIERGNNPLVDAAAAAAQAKQAAEGGADRALLEEEEDDESNSEGKAEGRNGGHGEDSSEDDSDEDSDEDSEEEQQVAVTSFAPIAEEIYSYQGGSSQDHVSAFVPVWEYGPRPLDSSLTMLDLHSHPVIRRLTEDSIDVGHVLLSGALELDFLLSHVAKQTRKDDDDDDDDDRRCRRRRHRRRRALEEEERNENDHDNDHEHSEDGEREEQEIDGLHSFFVQPVYQSFQADAPVAGFVLAVVSWDSFFADVLFDHVIGVVVVIEDSCPGGRSFTYRINGEEVEFVGFGDLHDPAYDSVKIEGPFAAFASLDLPDRTCGFRQNVYASDEFKATFQSTKPARYTTAVVLIFAFTAIVFLLYDWLVQRRQKKVLSTAVRTNDIVNSLFPKDVASRLQQQVAEAEEEANKMKRKSTVAAVFTNKADLRNFLHSSEHSLNSFGNSSRGSGIAVPRGKPIADLFPSVTVMFADLEGFTAWSSAREPCQVFLLLESIYATFDGIAKRRHVFKVETVGDCYVACCGLPDPRKDHAVVMARFSSDCLHAMYGLTRKLELELGPDTAELAMRFGLHSGPVTAGVLRGARQRFQLFGDTVNVTARMESTGTRDRIHVSQAYADQLYDAGKGHWLTRREEMVDAKGKGEMQTYWLELKQDAATSAVSTVTCSTTDPNGHEDILGSFGLKGPDCPAVQEKRMRLVDWNTELVSKKLKDVVARRRAMNVRVHSSVEMHKLEQDSLQKEISGDTLSQVAEVIHLPQYAADNKEVDSVDVELDPCVQNQLHGYIRTIAQMYRDNPFHNFEHASHVTMSVQKLMSRIIAPDLQDMNGDTGSSNSSRSSGENDLKSKLHDHTYGISDDPMTQLAMHLAAVIHDLDHLGVPNSQLIKEKASIAAVYKNSIAEQNSIDLAWHALMEDRYQDLRRAIYVNKEEFVRFRQVLVNAVMATDILDKNLGAARKERWNVAFAEAESPVPLHNVNRKATIVLEHLIQASDVSHTMQHWHIYRKWNARFFLECYKSYKEGRAEKNPADTWYDGEIGFFDYYIIPLAKKLKDCGVFGVSSDEYLNYAKENRNEWARRGKQLVAELVEIAHHPETISRFDACAAAAEEEAATAAVLAAAPRPTTKPARSSNNNNNNEHTISRVGNTKECPSECSTRTEIIVFQENSMHSNGLAALKTSLKSGVWDDDVSQDSMCA